MTKAADIMSPIGRKTVVTPQLLTEREAAKWLGVSPRTVWTLRSNGKIPIVRIGRAVRYDIHDLRSYIERLKAETRGVE